MFVMFFRLNRYFNAGMPYSRKPLQSLWFDIGIVATLILCPIACFLLTRTFVSLLWEILYVSEGESKILSVESDFRKISFSQMIKVNGSDR